MQNNSIYHSHVQPCTCNYNNKLTNNYFFCFLYSPGYLPFLSLITPILCQWQQSLVDHMRKTPGEAQQQVGTGVGSDPLDLLVNHEATGGSVGAEGGGEPTSPSETNKQISKLNNNKTDTPSQETAHQQQKQDETGGCVIN